MTNGSQSSRAFRGASAPGQDLLQHLLNSRSERLPVAQCRSMYLKFLWCPWPEPYDPRTPLINNMFLRA